MGYQLAVDLGTTYTAAALYRDGRVELVPLGDRSTVMPSVAFIRPDGEVLIGQAANRRGLLEPERVAREFKRRVGDPTPMVVGGSPYPADALVAHLLRAVVAQVSEREGARPDGLALTHPANWGAYKLDFLRQAVGHAGLGDLPVTLLPEPEAAALHYAASARVPPGAVVAVYDLGGGTFDAAVLRRRDEHGFEVVGRPEGIERLGGVDFDAGVFAHVDTALDGAVSSLEEDDEVAVQAVARLRVECVEAKEALSRDVEVAIPVVLPTRATTVRLTRAEFEAMIRPALAETITALRGALRSAGVSPEDVHAVLLVGGSSRIPLVGQMVSAELGRPIAVDAHPKHAVVQGAAAAVAARALASGPDAVTIVQTAEAAAPAEVTTPPAPLVPPAPPAPSGPPPGPAPAMAPVAPPVPEPPPPSTPGPTAPPSPAPSAPWAGRRRPILAAAAALVVLVGAVLALNAQGGNGDDGGGGGGADPESQAALPVAERDPAAPDVPDPEPAEIPDVPSPAVPDPASPSAPASTGTPPTSADATVQGYIAGCAGEAIDDCDRLYQATSADASHTFARTCGGRLPEEEASGDCIVRYGVVPTGGDPEDQGYVEGCGGDAVDDCDRLYHATSGGGPLHTYARTCGHRLDSEDASGDCIIRFNAVPSSSDADLQSYVGGCGGDAVDDCDRLYHAAGSGDPVYTYARTCGHRLDAEEANGDCIILYNAVPSTSDDELQDYVEGCADDAVDDCDRLYHAAGSGDPVYTYARTCGHRLDAEEANGDCLVRYNAVPTRVDEQLQDYVDGCSGDSVAACDDLYGATAGGSPLYTYARTCGHRLEEASAGGDCVTLGPDGS
jgi:molecular chaperone DnaK